MEERTVRFFFLIILALMGTVPVPAFSEFIGNFDLGPSSCEDTGLCTLTYDFKYKDPKGLEWQANAKNTTDGASIPPWTQPIIGKPFDPSYIKAAVIHDHYCVRQVRPWRDTHRVFYDALLELGIDLAKAKLMYYAVYLGGPKWVELMPGKSCGTSACINSIKTGQKIMQSRPAEYDRAGFREELQEVEKLLIQSKGSVSLSDLEKRAQGKRPNDFYYTNGPRVTTLTGLPTE